MTTETSWDRLRRSPKFAWGKYWNESWGVVAGCQPCSPGCEHCWAAGFAHRMRGYEKWRGLTDASGRWTGEVRTFPERLEDPLHWREPRVVAVGWMGDLALADEEFVRRMFYAMEGSALCEDGHVYLPLTKRPGLLMKKLGIHTHPSGLRFVPGPHGSDTEWQADLAATTFLGVTAESQEQWDERVPAICDPSSPAYWPGPKWVSVGPMLGPIDCGGWLGEGQCGIRWVVAECESGPGRRHTNPNWFRSLRNQCVEASVPFLLKQMEVGVGGRLVKLPDLDGLVWDQLPGGA